MNARSNSMKSNCVHLYIDVVRLLLLLLLLLQAWPARSLAEISQGAMDIDRGSGRIFHVDFCVQATSSTP
jgi:hypothetical protein